MLLICTFIFQSCTDDDCGTCFTPPEDFRFELVDKTSKENLFTNGTFLPNDIKIVNAADNSQKKFTFISENNINLIQISEIGFQTEMVNLKITIGSAFIFNFYVDAERKTEDCCSYTDYKAIEISGSDFELNTQTGVYKIIVD